MTNSIGKLVRQWRDTRKISQNELAHRAAVSPRHVSFIETGRSRPSRRMVVSLCSALDVPFREQNVLLTAAGFAPSHGESALDSPSLEVVRKALNFMLDANEPFPAFVVDRHWTMVMANKAAGALTHRLLGAPPEDADPPNMIDLVLSPHCLRPHIVNWDEVAVALIGRIHREALAGQEDPEADALLGRALSYPGIPHNWRRPNLTVPLAPVLPLVLDMGGVQLSLFGTIATFGTPQDITLQELRIESFFPADNETEAIMRAAASH